MLNAQPIPRASTIWFTPAGTVAATNVQAAIEELDADIQGLADSDDQTAAEVPFTPAGTVAATDVQSAIEELDADIQGLGSGYTDDDVIAVLTEVLEDGIGIQWNVFEDSLGTHFQPDRLETIIADSDAATITFDLSAATGGEHHEVTLAGNRTLALANEKIGEKFRVRLTQDATGGRNVTWWSAITWAEEVAPTLKTAANATDTFEFLIRDTGDYLGWRVGFVASSDALDFFNEAQSTSSPNDTVYVSQLLASGAATNIDAVVMPKGTGALLAAVPNSVSSGGNKRGSYAVDLQLARSNANEVASGFGSVIVGGQDNRAAGDYAATGGKDNVASGAYSAAFGNNNSASGVSAFAVGNSNAASGEHAFAANAGNSASGNYSDAFGLGALAEHHGESALSGGEFLEIGDAQSSVVHWRKQTTDATQSEALLNGTSLRFTIASDVTYGFELHAVARRTDADGESSYWIVRGCVDNNAGATALVGTIAIDTIADDSGAAWAVTAEADNTNDALVIKVTGAAGKTINWVIAGRMVRVKG